MDAKVCLKAGLGIAFSTTTSGHRALDVSSEDKSTGECVGSLIATVRLYCRWSQYRITERENIAHQVPLASEK